MYFNYVDSLSTGATVAITFAITFILTVIIDTIITFIVTYICVKQKFEKILQDLKNKQQNKTVLYEEMGLSSHTVTKDDFELQRNPSYGTSTSNKVTMDTNPVYENCK